MIKNFIDAEVKTLEEGSFEIVASSGKTDRLGDTIDPKGWYLKNYKKNPVILWSHSSGGFMSPAIPPVARADKVWVEDEKELKIKGHFADTPFAQELRSLVEGKFLNAVSVGFMPLVEDTKGDIEIESKMYRQITNPELKSYIGKGFIEINDKLYSKDGEHFTKQELLETSWVGVPALASALVSARKMNLPLLTKALEEVKGETKDAEEKTEIKPYPNEHSKGEEGTLEPAGESKEIEEKEGRIISKKNRKLIGNSITAMEDAISVLKELLEATEPEKDATPSELKGLKTFVKQKSKKSDMERILIMADKVFESLLLKIRKENDKR